MGASSSITKPCHIHICKSTKYRDEKHIVSNIITTLQNMGIHVSITDPSRSNSEIRTCIQNADVILMCSLQTYGRCPNQAIEYTYIHTLPQKPICDIVIDLYDTRSFTNHIQSFLQTNAVELSSCDDIPFLMDRLSGSIRQL